MSSPFKVTILGCGSATPIALRNPSSQYIEAIGRHILIDCGEGTQMQIKKFKVPFSKINKIFISHLHGDHYFGLMGLLQTMHLLGRNTALNLFGPKELKEIIDLQFKHSYTTLRYELNFTAIDTDVKQILFEDDYISIESFPLNHRVPCAGFIIREKRGLKTIKKEKLAQYRIPVASIQSIKQGEDFVLENGKTVSNQELTEPDKKLRSYAYCSDTLYDSKVIESVSNVTALYHEATFADDMISRAKETHHTTAKQAGNVAKNANVNQLIIGHFSARYPNIDTLLNEAKLEFSNTLAAYDGLCFDV